jgi:hypothetical protein
VCSSDLLWPDAEQILALTPSFKSFETAFASPLDAALQRASVVEAEELGAILVTGIENSENRERRERRGAIADCFFFF